MKTKFALLPLTALIIGATISVPANANNAEEDGITFPEVKKSYLKDIPRYDADELIHIDNGINDDTVRQLIGNPHFSEFMSNKWNYIIKIRKPSTREYIQCQLQLHFDKKDVVERYYWDKQECADIVQTALEPTAQQPEIRTFALSADLLFDFDSARLKSSSAFNIDKMTTRIRSDYNDITSITVVGHTDRLGAKSYNQDLSLQRANTIKNELYRRGFDASIIQVKSVGSSQPVTGGCYNMSHQQTKLCLAPDRRVELKVIGELK